MNLAKIREQAAERRNRDQARKAGLRTQVANERLAGAHAAYVGQMRSSGAFSCNHSPVGSEGGKTLIVFCNQCTPR
jgi:hypothetical protein